MGNLVKKLRNLFSSKEIEILIVGLENSGKSTLTAKLTEEEQVCKGPTIGLDIKTVKKNNVSIKIWDLGGQGDISSSIQVGVVKVRGGMQRYYIRG